MAKMGSFSASDFKKLQKQIDKLKQEDVGAFVDSCAKELAARLLAVVIPRTPVGNYETEVEVTAKRDSKYHKKGDTYTKKVNLTGKKGGTLRRGWMAKTHEEAASGNGSPDAMAGIQFAQALEIQKSNGYLTIEITNPVEYASYVEYGHRQTPGRFVPAIGKRLKSSWIPGKFMLTVSEQEIQKIAPQVLEAKVSKFLKGVM